MGIGMSSYQQLIREALAKLGHIDATDPRHVEGWMRLEHGCLDGLSRGQFISEIAFALDCIAAAPTSNSEQLAQSMGL